MSKEYFPTIYQNFIYKSRYARYLEKESRRENWEESIQRYFDFMQDHLKDEFNFDFKPLRVELENAVLNQKVMPSMRALMTAGPALARDHIAAYNCLRGDTKYITIDGIKTFGETVNSKQTVLTKDGMWADAYIQEFGTEKLYKVTFRPREKSRTHIQHVVFATKNHRWITSNRGYVSDLAVGDLVPSPNFVPEMTLDHPVAKDYFIRGFGYGDGVVQGNFCRIRLCGKKNELLPVFEGHDFVSSITSPNSCGEDNVIHFVKNAFTDCKDIPYDISAEHLYWWLQGYHAADGYKNGFDGIELSTQSQEAVDFIIKNAPRCGYVVTGHSIKSDMITNYGVRSAPLQILKLAQNIVFRVVEFEETDLIEPVYCATVPGHENFTLAAGIVTRNCAYHPLEALKCLDEELYILMNGTGSGFSVESVYTDDMTVPEELHYTNTTIVVEDSKLGWAKSFRELLILLQSGQIPKWDDSKVRRAGERLKTFGGRASGPEPLRELVEFTIAIFKNAVANKRNLSALDMHDLGCMVANIVVVGGVRRAALISLSDLMDDALRTAKSGAWYNTHGHRRLANNSAVYKQKPEIGVFMKEWLSLYESKSGERGIFNRQAAKKIVERANEFRKRYFGDSVRLRDTNHEFGTNPCSEIILRPYEFCNLTSVQVRPEDTLETLLEKVGIATILGTIQSTLTNFRYINKKWQKNCEDERLLGVSLNGIFDNELMNGKLGIEKLKDALTEMRAYAIKVNMELAKKIGINASAAITCIKPEGTTSALNSTASGMHARHSPFYIRYVRNDIKDPLTQFLIEAGIPYEADAYDPNNMVTFKFPMKSPEGAIFRKDITAIEHLELWKLYQLYWCDHKPSVSITVKEHEWLEVGAWVYENFDIMSGVSFFPADDHIYKQAPFSECTEEEYKSLSLDMPKTVDWRLLSVYEKEDSTVAMQTLACTASGGCEV